MDRIVCVDGLRNTMECLYECSSKESICFTESILLSYDLKNVLQNAQMMLTKRILIIFLITPQWMQNMVL